MTGKELLQKAIEARRMAYAPYSHYKVGACLLCADGSLYSGCNIENSAFGPSICAERTAIFKAVSEGKRDFLSIAIAGGEENALEDKLSTAYPCGVCRQVMSEFCTGDFRIYCGNLDSIEEYTLAELLPKSFGL